MIALKLQLVVDACLAFKCELPYEMLSALSKKRLYKKFSCINTAFLSLVKVLQGDLRPELTEEDLSLDESTADTLVHEYHQDSRHGSTLTIASFLHGLLVNNGTKQALCAALGN